MEYCERLSLVNVLSVKVLDLFSWLSPIETMSLLLVVGAHVIWDKCLSSPDAMRNWVSLECLLVHNTIVLNRLLDTLIPHVPLHTLDPIHMQWDGASVQKFLLLRFHLFFGNILACIIISSQSTPWNRMVNALVSSVANRYLCFLHFPSVLLIGPMLTWPSSS